MSLYKNVVHQTSSQNHVGDHLDDRTMNWKRLGTPLGLAQDPDYAI